MDGKCPWTILELLGRVEEAERRMIALPIMSFALDQWRAFRWVAYWGGGGGEARCVPQKIASPELGRIPIFSMAARRAQTLCFSALSVSVNYKRSSM